MKYLNDNRIIYRKYSEDQPTQEYKWGWYYADGTHGYYSLFNSPAKITTIRSLKWHLLTLWWLNPSMDKTKFDQLAEVITYKPNGFITFNVSNSTLNNVIDSIYMQDLERSPKNKLRKVIFKPYNGMCTEEKLRIVGQLIGRTKTVTQDDIYDLMLSLNHSGWKITIKRLAMRLNCSTRTIHRNMCEELKREKELLNKQL